mmetsp:Transcript_38199/g.100808  ORF Transcript_38199/g.100808 Transcript_38199/m.100808 type:complete len:395 (-) Transcript_38199:176-1360(-)|eukprot:CAMPEP_0115847284 /NCGR_PEP_ID=MMETSP0287-20121206/10303_1 /TAXON_ID=412157 /ORGANISM="Chrysochromulina rotalis, Strain UIO044" /LENGTH=394 /DNA_ID=CAMNT_0003301113 /DNA_START=343 /DNA_END=1527 /DNA_ORIENTATION=-
MPAHSQVDHGRVRILPPHVACAYAMVPSRAWILGLYTLLHSLVVNLDADDQCGLLFLSHPLLPDSQLTEQEWASVETLAGKHSIHRHNINTSRIKLWGSVPYLRSGANMSFAKMELFYAKSHAILIFLDLDMLVLKSMSFVHRALQNESAHDWKMHGSANFYGIAGWVFEAETTPLTPRYINAGWLAFRAPVPDAFLNAIEARIHARLVERIKTFSADQDVVNHALADSQMKLHDNWYTNYRPPSLALLKEKWVAVHWMGVTKPWGKHGHTIAPVRYNDRVIMELDRRWRSQCEGMKRLLAASGTASAAAVSDTRLECSVQPTRHPPGRLPDQCYYLIVLGAIAWGVSAYVWFALFVRKLLSCEGRAAIIIALQVMWLWACISVADEGRRPARA